MTLKLKMKMTTKTLVHIGKGVQELAITVDGDGSGRPSAILWKEPNGERLLMATAEEIERLAALLFDLRAEADHRDNVYVHAQVCPHHGYWVPRSNADISGCPHCSAMLAAEEAEQESAGLVTEDGKRFLATDSTLNPTTSTTTPGKAA